MIELLLQPFHYNYMVKAIWVSAGVGAVCAFLSAYLMLKGWSLMGDALSHSVVPGVAGAYALGFPYAIGAFGTGILAALSMTLLRHYTRLREDAIIGFVFSSFFALGLLLVSLNPTSVNVQSILFGNILGIDDADILQVQIIVGVSLLVLCVIWRDLLAVFFDEAHARSVGLSPLWLKVIFFTLFSACSVAALQTVGAILVIAMVITPGATAYLLTDRFSHLLMISVAIGAVTSAVGAWLSYYLDGATGGVIVCLQTSVFLLAFVFAPKHGWLANHFRIRAKAQHKESAS
ncbi:MAG: metal ABC transporter permease [Ewingella americana]|jgi:manganese/iron transport system permease protein|uniref:Permease component of an ABC superfamily manganese transporter n=2 Tax=Ewingella americana TaxID=41202 RepID=A0A085G141_EWIA3|nr:metal ABC transporter permease [Ewingella americana]KAA8726705.1 metal ABC transporter permease [Ewingella americana]KFC77436.1 permease component of an ABC superfamily manganese transporter [Ewingella americana ATCC 33852]MCI1678214.1 metal ABC transporter permease [Ewingella americana]MCI1856149.1 metal ABC transporter permease [Ewingella americana]MCI1862374.1 metal ABC transporter permease [Ewingella americana]